MTLDQQSTVVGVFEDRAMAEQVVSKLKQAGFREDQIEFADSGEQAHGLLASLKSLFTAENTAAENVYNDLAAIGMPPEDARYYQQEYENGHSIVAVSDGARLQEAGAILMRSGGYGAQRRSTQAVDEPLNAHMQETEDTASSHAGGQETIVGSGEEHAMRLREEQLRVYKRPVQAGEVNVRKEVVAEQQTLNVPVTREEVYVERHPIAEKIADTTPIGEGETISVPVSEEQVNVRKQTVETGEVEVSKQRVKENQRVRDTVRREKAHIEREGDAPIHNTKTDPFHPSNKDADDLLDE